MPALPAGRPYFVMELVRGIRITDYCDQANLSTKERLDQTLVAADVRLKSPASDTPSSDEEVRASSRRLERFSG